MKLCGNKLSTPSFIKALFADIKAECLKGLSLHLKCYRWGFLYSLSCWCYIQYKQFVSISKKLSSRFRATLNSWKNKVALNPSTHCFLNFVQKNVTEELSSSVVKVIVLCCSLQVHIESYFKTFVNISGLAMIINYLRMRLIVYNHKFYVAVTEP